MGGDMNLCVLASSAAVDRDDRGRVRVEDRAHCRNEQQTVRAGKRHLARRVVSRAVRTPRSDVKNPRVAGGVCGRLTTCENRG